MAEAANLQLYHGAQAKDSILQEYSTFHLEFLTTPTLFYFVNDGNQFYVLIPGMMPDGAGLVTSYVEKAKSGASCAESYKNCICLQLKLVA